MEGEGVSEILQLLYASVKSSDGDIYYNNSEIIIDFKVKVAKKVPSLVIGFNLYSSWGHPLARADYNDNNDLTTLGPGIYCFIFKIPPYTLSDGDYHVIFDVAERNIKCLYYGKVEFCLSLSFKGGQMVLAIVFVSK